MNVNAHTSNLAIYKNKGLEKRNHYNSQTERAYYHSETERKLITQTSRGGYSGPEAVISSVIKAFRGTIVSPDPGTSEFHCREIFPEKVSSFG